MDTEWLVKVHQLFLLIYIHSNQKVSTFGGYYSREQDDFFFKTSTHKKLSFFRIPKKLNNVYDRLLEIEDHVSSYSLFDHKLDFDDQQSEKFCYGFIEDIVEITLEKEDHSSSKTLVLARISTFNAEDDAASGLRTLKIENVNDKKFIKRFSYYAHINHVLDKIFLLPKPIIRIDPEGIGNFFIIEGIDIQSKYSVLHHSRLASCL